MSEFWYAFFGAASGVVCGAVLVVVLSCLFIGGKKR